MFQRVAQLRWVLVIHARDGPDTAGEKVFQFQRQTPGAVEQPDDTLGFIGGDG